MAWIGKSHSCSKTELTSSTHLFTDNHHTEALNTPEGEDPAHPIDPKLFPGFSSSSYFCCMTAFTDQKLLDQLQKSSPSPTSPKEPKLQEITSMGSIIRGDTGKPQSNAMGAQSGVMKGDSYCCWTAFENVSNHQGVICILSLIKAGKQWTAKHQLLQGKYAEVLKNPQLWLLDIQSTPQLSREV